MHLLYQNADLAVSRKLPRVCSYSSSELLKLSYFASFFFFFGNLSNDYYFIKAFMALSYDACFRHK